MPSLLLRSRSRRSSAPKRHSGITYPLTGPRAMTFDEGATMIAAVSGRPITSILTKRPGSAGRPLELAYPRSMARCSVGSSDQYSGGTLLNLPTMSRRP